MLIGIELSADWAQACKQHFVAAYNPTIEDTHHQTFATYGHEQGMQIIDTGGAEQYMTTVSNSLQDADFVIFVYDITRRSSLTRVEGYRELLPQANKAAARGSSNETSGGLPVMLLGNKSDLEHDRAVPQAAGRAYAEQFCWLHMETSARSNINVERAISEILNQARKQDDRANATHRQRPVEVNEAFHNPSLSRGGPRGHIRGLKASLREFWPFGKLETSETGGSPVWLSP